jgi:hypothetical protein
MNIELDQVERDLLSRILDSYLSELRLTIAATQTGTSGLHSEEDLVKGLQAKVAKAGDPVS